MFEIFSLVKIFTVKKSMAVLAKMLLYLRGWKGGFSIIFAIFSLFFVVRALLADSMSKSELFKILIIFSLNYAQQLSPIIFFFYNFTIYRGHEASHKIGFGDAKNFIQGLAET